MELWFCPSQYIPYLKCFISCSVLKGHVLENKAGLCHLFNVFYLVLIILTQRDTGVSAFYTTSKI